MVFACCATTVDLPTVAEDSPRIPACAGMLVIPVQLSSMPPLSPRHARAAQPGVAATGAQRCPQCALPGRPLPAESPSQRASQTPVALQAAWPPAQQARAKAPRRFCPVPGPQQGRRPRRGLRQTGGGVQQGRRRPATAVHSRLIGHRATVRCAAPSGPQAKTFASGRAGPGTPRRPQRAASPLSSELGAEFGARAREQDGFLRQPFQLAPAGMAVRGLLRRVCADTVRRRGW